MENRRAETPITSSDANPLNLSSRIAYQTSLRSRWKLLFAVVALAMAAFAAGRQVAAWPTRIRYPGELDSTEGRMLADMVALREGVPVYAPASPERYNSVEYGPFFYLLGSRLIDPQHPGYFWLRVLSMLGTLGLAAGSSVLGWWLARSYLAAVLAPLIFLAYTLVTMFGVTVRCDSVALFLGYCGFLIAHRFRRSRKVLLAIPFMELGLYYKGQYLAGFLAIVLFLLLEKRLRLAAAFAGLMGAGALTLFLVWQFVIFRHQAFGLHAVVYNVIPFSIENSLIWAIGLGGTVFVGPALAASLYLWSRPNRPLACYIGIAAILLLVGLGKQGASSNYCLELLVVLCPLLAALVAEWHGTPFRALVALSLLVVTLKLGPLFGPSTNPHQQDFSEDKALQTYLRQQFPVHSVGLSLMTGDLLRAGLETPIANLYQYSFLACKGTIPEEAFLKQIRERRFRVILYNLDLRNREDAYSVPYMCLTEPIRQAILKNYRLDAEFKFHVFDIRHYYAWVPR